ITLTAVDTGGSGVAYKYYRLNAGPDTTYTVPVVVSTEGTTTFWYWSKDASGNVETAQHGTIELDKTRPVATTDALDIYTGPATITVSATDAWSGIAHVRWSLDGGPWVWDSVATTSALGNHTIAFYAQDGAGWTDWPFKTKDFEIKAPDFTPPVTTLGGVPGGWSSVNVTPTLTATDGVGAGVAAIMYRKNAGANQTYSPPLVISDEGTTTLWYWSVDLATPPNTEAERSVPVYVDKSGPVSTSDAIGLYTGTATITISATDPYSGVSHTHWRFDSDPWQTGTVAATSAVGPHTLYFYSTDNVNNDETPVQSMGFLLLAADYTPPTTTVSGVPVGWTSQNATLTLTAVDNAGGAGVASRWFRFGTGAAQRNWPAPSVPCVVSAEGTTTVWYWSVDAATPPNTESAESTTVLVDKTAPVTTAGGGTTYVASASINLSATDGMSGVDWTKWRIDAGGWQTGTVAVTTALGPHTLEFYSADKAGNQELPHKTKDFTVVSADAVPPLTTASGIPLGWASYNVTVTLSAVDNAGGAGVASTWYRLGVGSAVAYPPCVVTAEGTTTLAYWSVDGATPPNREAEKTATVRIDKTRPTTAYLGAATLPSGSSVVLAESDALSGVAFTRYSIDGGPEDVYGGFIPMSDGTHVLTFYSVDNAGNSQVPVLVTLKVGAATPPPPPGVPVATWITIRTNATSARIGGIPILSGEVSPAGLVGRIVVVYVKKPGKTYWSYSSNRVVYSRYGVASWQYKYYFKPGMARGYYYYKAAVPGS
ncbi:MAG TPA: hypothetical protein VF902_02680, partial [Coriobacteriia bacterium]